MPQPVTIDTRNVDPAELSGHCPREIHRRLRHVSVLIAAAELPSGQREQILRRVRGHLAGTIHKLDRLIADVCAAPVSMDDQLTERHQASRIARLP